MTRWVHARPPGLTSPTVSQDGSLFPAQAADPQLGPGPSPCEATVVGGIISLPPPRGRFRGPVLGAGEPLFWRPRGRPPEAGIYWKGYNFYEAEAHARGRPLVRINMDETSVPVVPAPLRGVVMRSWRYHTFARPGRLRTGRQQQRANLTYVAFVSDDPELNRHFAQVVIGRKSILLLRDFPKLFNLAPDTIYLMRSDSGWAAEAVLRETLGLLAEVLHHRRPDHVYVLAFDCAPKNLQPALLWLLRGRGMCPLLVPAKMIWLRQPLDVYCFRYFKAAQAFLRQLQPAAECGHHAVVLAPAL